MAETRAVLPQAGELTRHRRPLKALTGIRFFAALYVVLFHSRLGSSLHEHGHARLGNFFLSGYLAVALFFILSGFILAYTYEGQIERPGDHRRFWEARFARVWPAYAISLFAISLPSFKFPPPGHMLACLLMLQSWNPWDVQMSGDWNAVCWTLSAEAFFYFVFPWLQVWLERLSTPLLQVAMGSAILLCILLNTSPRTFGYTPEGFFRWLPLALLHTPEFVVGVALGNLFLRRVLPRDALMRTAKDTAGQGSGRGVWTYTSLAVAAALLCTPTNRWTSAIVPVFGALVFGLALERTLVSRFLSTRVLLLGGGISYSMYLMQLPVKFWVIAASARLHVHGDTARLLVNFALLTGISLMLFLGVEEPARRWIRRGFAALNGVKSA